MQISNRPVALVTGSATGVGRACVLQLAARGYNVVVNYSRSRDDALATVADAEQQGAEVLLVCCDVSDDAAVRAMIDRVTQRFGRLDVLVNNAAMTNFVSHDDLEGLSEAMWDRMLAVNLKGPFFVTRAAADLLRRRRRQRCQCQQRRRADRQRIIHRLLCLQSGLEHDDQVACPGIGTHRPRQCGLSGTDR